jgi:hypothetical protein
MKPMHTIENVLKRGMNSDEAERQYAIIAPRLSWPMLAALEPALADLLHAARNADSHRSTDSFCSIWFWHGGDLKQQMLQLVGHERPDFHPILGTSAAYDLAYDTLFAAIPPCRNCQNCGPEYENTDSVED